MPRSRGQKGPKHTANVQQPTPPTQDEQSDDLRMADHDDAVEKDDTELELEKLVFGDNAGFQEGLKSYGQRDIDLDSSGAEDESKAGGQAVGAEEELEAVDDADLFFLDTEPATTNVGNLTLAQPSSFEEDDADSGHPPAWIDSDDERITVSLASNPRLRKLRVNEGEDVINGREYTKRLRRQFERLYPVPEWANPSAAKTSASRKKRRRTSNANGSSDSDDVASDMSLDSDGDISTQPLAKLLQNAGSLTQPTSTSSMTRKRLRPEVLDIQRTKDVGGAQPSAITSLSFHPQSSLLLSSGPASSLHLHHISPSSPSPNPLLTTLHIRSTHPLTTSLFHPPHGSKIFFSSPRRYFHTWNLQTGKVDKISRVYGHADEQRSMERFKLSPCGRWMGLVGSARKGGGVVNVLDAGTCQWVAQVRVEGKGGVADFAWWADGEGVVVIGKGGEAVEWSRGERRVVARWIDEGAVGTTVLALGGGGGSGNGNNNNNNNNKNNNKKSPLGPDRWIAIGSQSGIVNIYDRTAWTRPSTSTSTPAPPGEKKLPEAAVPERPKPTKTLAQLTTPTSHLAFSPDGQLLVMASRWKRDALRLVHIPSLTTYRNWPTSSTPFGRISSVAFAPTSEMLAVGNEQGRIRLWEIRC